MYAELNKRVKTANSSYSATGEFLQYIYSVLVAKNHQKIRSRCLVHEFFVADIFLTPFYCLISTMKMCAERCALQLYCTSLSIFVLFQLQSWIISRVRTKFLIRNFHAKRVVMKIAMMKILNNCISCRLNNNHFPFNESSTLY